MEDFYVKLETEIQRQDDLYGDCDYHPVEWLGILTEETGEISRAINEASHNGAQRFADTRRRGLQSTKFQISTNV